MALVSTEAQLRTMSPGPERFMTMNLMSAGPCTVSNGVTSYGRTVRRMRTRDNHTTADVHGAQTFVRTSTLTNKPDSYGISDIEGTSSMRLHKDTNKPDRQLFHDDIEGSRPKIESRFRTNRLVDPLEPEYMLPSYVPAPNVYPKFTRDSFDVSDIEGTTSRPLYPFAERQNHHVDDIEGAKAGWKPRHVRARRDAPPLDHTLNVSDITGGGFRTRRTTNPLTPSYHVNGMDIADDAVGSRPRALPKAKDEPFYPLTTVDIEGAQPGWRPMPQMNPPLEARRHFRNTNYVGDIPGAQADTVERSICTDRRVNPLYPTYASLDGEPLTNPQTPLYMEPAAVEAEAQLDRTIAREEASSAVAAAVAHDDSDSVVGPDSSPGKKKQTTGVSEPISQRNLEHQLHILQPGSRRDRPASDPLPSSHRSGGRSGGRGSYRHGGAERTEKHKERRGASSSHSTASRSPAQNSNDCSKATIRRLEREARELRKDAGGGEGSHDGARQSCESSSSRHSAVATSNHRSGTRITAQAWSDPASDTGRCNHARRAITSCSKRGGAKNTMGTSRSDDNMLRRRFSASSEDSQMGCKSLGGGGGAPRAPFSGSNRVIESAGTRRRDVSRGRQGGGAMEILSRGRQSGGSEGAERLVLRSANGTPRVPLTPAERRVAREYVDDVSSVRDLL